MYDFAEARIFDEMKLLRTEADANIYLNVYAALIVALSFHIDDASGALWAALNSPRDVQAIIFGMMFFIGLCGGSIFAILQCCRNYSKSVEMFAVDRMALQVIEDSCMDGADLEELEKNASRKIFREAVCVNGRMRSMVNEKRHLQRFTALGLLLSFLGLASSLVHEREIRNVRHQAQGASISSMRSLH